MSAGRATPEIIALTLIVAIGVALRFVSTSTMWLDEALTVNVASLPLADIPGALERDGLPPLYYGLLHGWMQLVGDSDVAARALSGLLAVLTLPMIYLAGRRLGGRTVGLLAVALLALNPFALRYATEVRMYSLIMVLVLAGFLLVDASLRDPRPWRLVGTAFVSGALLLTHYWTFWLVGAVVVVLAWQVWRGQTDQRRASLRSLAAVCAGGLLFLPWLPVFLTQAAHTATPWAEASRPTSIVALTIEDFGGSIVAEAKLVGLALMVLVALGLFGRAIDAWHIELDLRTRPQVRFVAMVVVVTLALGASVGLVTDSAFASRYASVVFPLFILVAAVGASRFVGRGARALVVGSVVVLGLAVSVNNATEDRTQGGVLATAIVEGSTEAAETTGVGEPIVVYCPDQLGPAVHRELPADGYEQLIYPELESAFVDSPERVDWYDYAERHATSEPSQVAASILERAGDDRTIWVVSSATYRAVDHRCTDLLSALSAARGGWLVVAEDGDAFFEHASLHVYPSSGS